MVGALLLAGGCTAGSPHPTVPPAVPKSLPMSTPGYTSVNVTLYAAFDNDPAGSTDIAYPNQRHQRAGGLGTFEDPISLATDPHELPPGTMIYYDALRKYFVMEDDCAPCIQEWAATRRPHVDLWVSATSDQRVISCEEALTPPGQVSVEVNPPPGRAVDVRPIYASGRCWPST